MSYHSYKKFANRLMRGGEKGSVMQERIWLANPDRHNKNSPTERVLAWKWFWDRRGEEEILGWDGLRDRVRGRGRRKGRLRNQRR